MGLPDNYGHEGVVIYDTSGAPVAGGGGGGGGAATIADGADVNAGSTTDAAATAGGTGTIAAKLRGASRDIGALTETAPASDTASSGLNGRLQRIAQRLTSLIALLPAALGAGGGIKVDGSGTPLPVASTLTAGELHLGEIGGVSARVRLSKTRPADTTAYTAGDAIDVSTSVPTGWVFTNLLRKTSGGGMISYLRLATDQVANVATYQLDLYSAAPTYPNDNAEAAYLFASEATLIGTIPIPALAKPTANSTAAVRELSGALLDVPAGLAAGRDIFGILKPTLAFTPSSGQQFSLTLGMAQD